MVGKMHLWHIMSPWPSELGKQSQTWQSTGSDNWLTALLKAVDAFFKVIRFFESNWSRSKTKPPDSWVKVVKWVFGSWICGLSDASSRLAVKTLSFVKPYNLEFILLLAKPLKPSEIGATKCSVIACSVILKVKTSRLLKLKKLDKIFI